MSNKEVTSEKKAAEQGGDDNRCEKGAESDNKSRSASVEIETASYSSKCGNTGDVEERTDMVKSGNTASSTGNNESGKEYTSTGKAGNEVDKGNTVTDKTEDDRGGQEAGLPNKTGCSVTPALSSSARKLPEHGETANQGAADKDAGPANQGQKENPENKSTNKSVDSVADPVHEPSPTSSQEMPFNEDKDRNQPKTSAATEPPSPAKSIPSPGRKTPKSASKLFYTRYHFSPEANLDLQVLSLPSSVCVCVRLCVYPLCQPQTFHHLFKLKPPTVLPTLRF